MAREKTPEENAADNERKQLVEEKKNLKKEQQAQRKEAKRRAKEIAKQEDELEDGNEGNSLLTFGACPNSPNSACERAFPSPRR